MCRGFHLNKYKALLEIQCVIWVLIMNIKGINWADNIIVKLLNACRVRGQKHLFTHLRHISRNYSLRIYDKWRAPRRRTHQNLLTCWAQSQLRHLDFRSW